jgi:amidase
MRLDEYANHDGLGLADLVRRGEVSAAELAALAQSAIDALNPQLNAVIGRVEPQPPAGGAAAPFHGVPFLIKDLVLHAQGVPCDMGSRLVAGAFTSPHDTELMARFRAAGLVTLGRSNTPEFGFNATTEPLLHGPTRNPWDLTRSAGGSSGGSAAAVAAGIVPVAHANDGGGSIRIPAAQCGLVGLKPTRGRTPVGPETGMPLHDLGIEHVVTRTLRDCAALLDAVEGPAPGDRFAIARPARPYADELRRAPPRPLRIAFHADGGAHAVVDPQCRAAVEAVAAQCQALGHHVEPAKPAYDEAMFDRVNLCYWTSFLAGAVTGLAAMLGRTPSAENLEACTWASVQHGLSLRAVDLEEADVLANLICRSVAAFFQRYDLLLTPVTAAPPIALGVMDCNRSGLDAAGWLREVFRHMPFTALYNLTGQPAFSLPLASSAEGLPIGVQLVARYGDEATLFNLGGQLEQAMPWAARRPAIHVANVGRRR